MGLAGRAVPVAGAPGLVCEAAGPDAAAGTITSPAVAAAATAAAATTVAAATACGPPPKQHRRRPQESARPRSVRHAATAQRATPSLL